MLERFGDEIVVKRQAELTEFGPVLDGEVREGRIADREVEVGGQGAKPSRLLRVGDQLHVRRGEERFDIAVLGLSDVRGPAPVAQALYAETEESKQARARAAAERRAAATGYRPPATKPDKRARRLIQALGDLDAS